MDKIYWDSFYKVKRTTAPTAFVVFCRAWLHFYKISRVNKIYDLGCGNGRDTSYWAYQGFISCGIDQSVEPKKGRQWILQKSNLIDFLEENRCANLDLVYSRFFLHAIEKEELLKLIKWTKGYFMAEFRIEGDIPKLYHKHKRNFIIPTKLHKILLDNNYEILYYRQGTGLARLKKENPLIGRIIAKKII